MKNGDNNILFKECGTDFSALIKTLFPEILIDQRLKHYLLNTCKGSPWFKQLTLLTLISINYKRLDYLTIKNRISSIHNGLNDIFVELSITAMNQWNPDTHLKIYMEQQICTHHSKPKRTAFWSNL